MINRKKWLEIINSFGFCRIITAVTFVTIATLLHALRRVDQIVNPQFWAEDGVIFFQDEITHGFSAIFTPYSGYLHFLPRLIAFTANNVVSIDNAPTAYVVGSLIISATTGLIIAFSRIPWPAGPLFTLSTVLVPHGGEVFLNLTNLQWIIAPLLLLISIQKVPRWKLGTVLDLCVIVVVGLTGPFIIFSAPFIVGRLVWLGRSRHNILLAITATIVAIIQMSFLYQTNHMGGDSTAIIEMKWDLIQLFWSTLLINFVTQTPFELKLYLYYFVCSLVLISVLFLPNSTKIISVVFLSVTVMIFVTAAKKWGAQLETMQPLGAGQRYFYIPYVLVSWIFILSALQGPKPTNWIAVALIVMTIASSARSFQAPPLPDMEWRKHLADVHTEAVKIPINPVGWFVTVHR